MSGACAIADAITNAEQILKRIDERWPDNGMIATQLNTGEKTVRMRLFFVPELLFALAKQWVPFPLENSNDLLICESSCYDCDGHPTGLN